MPLLLVPLIAASPERPGVQDLILYVGAFGALGHHLPGMMRAYGDRELFRRFRIRLVLAPAFLILVCVGFSVSGLGGVVLLTFLWTTWHTLMQVYGFARIYDSKAAPAARRAGWLDQALCIAWIAAPLAYSDSRVAHTLELYYRCGGPLVPAGVIDAARVSWLALTAAVTMVFAARILRSWRSGVRPNPVKLLFLAASFGFWWFCMAAVEHLAAGIALFDVFHDVQYLALVWLFQRARVAGSAGVTGFTRFLFRSSGSLAGLYVGLVVAYGSLGHFTGMVASDTVRNALLGVLAASALFHFYLDGFIWKVRERTTREGLGLDGGTAPVPEARRLPVPVRHVLLWCLFVVPLGLCLIAETGRRSDHAIWRAAIVEAAPGSAEALTALGTVALSGGDAGRAIELHRRAIGLKPSAPEPRNNLGVALRLQGNLEEARTCFEAAIRLRPGYALAHGHLANLLLQLGETGRAETHFRDAMRADARYADPRANLAALLVRRGDLAGAVPLFREALAIEPENRGALNNLAWILATSSAPAFRDPEEALALAGRFDRLTGHRLPQALDTLAAALAAADRFEEADRTAGEAVTAALAGGNEGLARQVGIRREAYRARQALRLP